MPKRLNAPSLLLSLLALLAGPAAGQGAPPPAEKPAEKPVEKPAGKPASPLALESVEIRPAHPGPDTLCQLRVKLKNGGTKKASVFAFTVRINGEPVPVYQRQTYLQTVDPGTVGEVRLFNFWTTETRRPLPKDGQLRVEVALDEARWVEVKNEGGAEVTTPLDKVPGLPVQTRLAVPLQAAAPAKPPK
ncbi:MAG TPA: CARDB domain-containing protein [Thermoanaerobaculia bacterium]|nr:CARDB domain-containing protein [Thermoanaerobaculia bacterium]